MSVPNKGFSSTTYAADIMLNALFRGIDPPAPPDILYVGLFTARPDDSALGTEVTGGAYARQAVVNLFGQSSWGGPGVGAYAGEMYAYPYPDWPVATADWGTLLSFGIFDAATGGNLLFYDDFVDYDNISSGYNYLPITILSGDRLVMAWGSSEITAACLKG